MIRSSAPLPAALTAHSATRSPRPLGGWLRIGARTTVHVLAFAAVYAIAFALRFDFAIPADALSILYNSIVWVALIKLAAFYTTGSYHGSWRYVTFADLLNLLKATLIASLTIWAVDALLIDSYRISRAIILLDSALTGLTLGGLRCLWRLGNEPWLMQRRSGERRVLIVGADPASAMLAQQVLRQLQPQVHIVGFVDRHASRVGTYLAGLPVLGHFDNLIHVAERAGVHELLVLDGNLPGDELRSLMDRTETTELTWKALPSLADLLSGKSRQPLRDVDINDLLRREPVTLDLGAIGQSLAGRVVLVTGAGGSIGSEICRQVLRFRPATLVLVEKGENSLFHLERELLAAFPQIPVRACVADVLDTSRMESIFAQYRPHAVFHAAAHKHVPLMEHNPGEAIKNNVLGTKCVADLAHRHAAERFVLISTDKAVNPTSVMGATKRLAERYIHALAQSSPTRLVVVRFGNVLGSSGSVVPIFQEQIRRGGPVCITHPAMRRFFMTIPEASQLVLQAAAMGRGGEIFVLDMGQQVRIVDLARDLIRLSGLSERDIEIRFTGIRPGEKLYEELHDEHEHRLATGHPKVFSAYHPSEPLFEVERSLEQLLRRCDESPEVVRRALQELIPSYTPTLVPESPTTTNESAPRETAPLSSTFYVGTQREGVN